MVRRIAVIGPGAILFLFLAAAPALADIHIGKIDTSGFPNVAISVASDDGATASVSQVRVVENGVPVETRSVSPAGSGFGAVDAVLAIDVSNSMRGDDLATALAAAKEFVRQVPGWIDIGVVAFADTATVVTPVTRDRAAVSSNVDAIGATTTAGTSLFDAVVAASKMFTGPGQHNLIVVTDGRNTRGTSDLQDAVAAAHRAGMTVYPIGLAGPQTDESTLRRLASATGGGYRSISLHDLDAVYSSLARQLSEQYVVRYSSKVPRGVTAEITVWTPSGRATVHVLTPPIRTDTSRPDGILDWLYTTNLGLALSVLLSFLAAVSFLTLVTRTRWAAQRQELLRRRLGASAGAQRPQVHGSAAAIPQPVAEAAAWTARATGLSPPVERLLERAAWRLAVGEFFAVTAVAAFAAVLVVGLLTHNAIPGLAASGIVAMVPYVVLSRAARKRGEAVQRQLADVLMVLASALRAGHSFLQALDTVSKEVGDPAASEFGRALAEMRLGRSVDDALTALAQRIGSQDLDWAVTAISIQRRVGGNLAEVLETLAGTIRERETLRRQMRVLSSEGRLSVIILTVLPFLIGSYIMVVNPSYGQTLTGTKLGLMMLGGGGLLMIVGYVWMRRIVRLDV
jgi:tight adherence protein B